MADARHSQRRRRATVAVGLVTALAGLLFATNARLFWGRGHGASGLEGLVREENQAISELTDAQAELAADIDALLAAQPEGSVEPDVPGMGIADGSEPVAGPGVQVTLDDAPLPADQSIRLDDYIVHQKDVEAVLNTLWAAGAEAVAVQGVRVSSTTSLRCVGNVLLVGGRVFSPPYLIEAIGDPDTLGAALDKAPALAAYRDAADLIGLGWSVGAADSLQLSGASGGSIGLRYVAAL